MHIIRKRTKEKREQFISLTFTWYRQTPYNSKRVKAHAIGVSILTFTLSCS